MNLIEDTAANRQALLELAMDHAMAVNMDDGDREPPSAIDYEATLKERLAQMGLRLTVEPIPAVDHETELLRAAERT